MNTTEYQKTCARYSELAKKARSGDPVAIADKAKAMNDIRAIERDAARNGAILRRAGAVIPRASDEDSRNVVRESGVVRETDTKRSLQEEYCRRFDDRKEVLLNGKKTTMRDYHRERLLGKR